MAEVLIEFIKGRLLGLDTDINRAIMALKIQFIFDGDSGFYEFIHAVMTIIKPFALTLIGICFLIEFLKMTIKFDILKPEFFFKVFFKLVFAKVCIDMCYDLLMAIYTQVCEWISELQYVNGDTQAGRTVWLAVKDSLNEYSGLEWLGVVVSSFVIFIGIYVCSLIIRVMAYARMIEITLYLAISPLPMAFLPMSDGGGASRIPKHFILNFASVCLSGLFIVMAIKLYTVVTGTFIMNLSGGSSSLNVTTGAGALLISTVMLLICVTKASSFANKTLDVMG